MRRYWIAALALVLSVAAGAQAPPQSAIDITNVPAGQVTAPAVSGSTAPGVVRIYLDTLNGADATSLQGLLTQALFESKKVVITENQANATLIIKGSVLRQLPPAAAPKKTARRGHPRAHAAATQAALPGGLTDAGVVKDLDNATDLDSLSLSGGDGSAGIGLPPLDLNNPADLSRYDYRLNLRLLRPDGDLVWMSGQGEQAPAFASASQAVKAAVGPMLTAIASEKAGGAGDGGTPQN